MKQLLFLLLFPCIMQAQTVKADGKTDDLSALQLAAKAGNVSLPEGKKIRITDTWVIGDDFMDFKNLFNANGIIDLKKYHNAQYSREVNIQGNGCTIWLDNPDTTKAVIIYNAQGLNGAALGGKIENILLIGNGTGISSAYTKHLKLYNVKFKGFKNGLILNNSHFIDCQNLDFQNCQRAEYDIRCHRGNFSNTTLGGCKKGFEIRSNNMIVMGYYSSFCNTGLHVAAGNNEFHSAYLESILAGEGQLIIGDATGMIVDGNVFSTLVVSAPNPLNKGIVFMPTAGTVSFIGGGAQSTFFSVLGKPTVIANNFKASLPKEILKQ